MTEAELLEWSGGVIQVVMTPAMRERYERSLALIGYELKWLQCTEGKEDLPTYIITRKGD